MYAQIITSSLTVGLGGSAGLESHCCGWCRWIKLCAALQTELQGQDPTHWLWSAAGIAAAFNITGVLFAIEFYLSMSV
jgi:CIC family chloride channel protein